jgi:hypothetical protein
MSGEPALSVVVKGDLNEVRICRSGKYGLDGSIFDIQFTEDGVSLTGTTHRHSCGFSADELKKAADDIERRIQEVEHFNSLILDAILHGETYSMRILMDYRNRLRDSLTDYTYSGSYVLMTSTVTTTTIQSGPVTAGELYKTPTVTFTVFNTSLVEGIPLHNLPVPVVIPQNTCVHCAVQQDIFIELPTALKKRLAEVCPELEGYSC